MHILKQIDAERDALMQDLGKSVGELEKQTQKCLENLQNRFFQGVLFNTFISPEAFAMNAAQAHVEATRYPHFMHGHIHTQNHHTNHNNTTHTNENQQQQQSTNEARQRSYSQPHITNISNSNSNNTQQQQQQQQQQQGRYGNMLHNPMPHIENNNKDSNNNNMQGIVHRLINDSESEIVILDENDSDIEYPFYLHRRSQSEPAIYFDHRILKPKRKDDNSKHHINIHANANKNNNNNNSNNSVENKSKSMSNDTDSESKEDSNDMHILRQRQLNTHKNENINKNNNSMAGSNLPPASPALSTQSTQSQKSSSKSKKKKKKNKNNNNINNSNNTQQISQGPNLSILNLNANTATNHNNTHPTTAITAPNSGTSNHSTNQNQNTTINATNINANTNHTNSNQNITNNPTTHTKATPQQTIQNISDTLNHIQSIAQTLTPTQLSLVNAAQSQDGGSLTSASSLYNPTSHTPWLNTNQSFTVMFFFGILKTIYVSRIVF